MGNVFGILIEILAFVLTMMTGTKVALVKKEPVQPLPVPDKHSVGPLPSKPFKGPSSHKYKLGMRSKRELVGVHPQLVKVVKRAIQITDMDFTVFDGKRSAKEQNRHFKNGASQLDGYKKKSYHQSGNAVDLVPVINGRENHGDWDNYYHLAEAMVAAAKELGVAKNIRWGAVWDRRANRLPDTASALKKESRAYADRHPGKDFLDGPHYEYRP